jgi:Esterase/lipase
MLLLHAGYFPDGSREDPDMQALGMAFARRGYVAVSADYRLRPNAATNLDELIATTHDARDDAIGAMGWIQHHADALRIDPAAVVATGYSAGAVIALNLAYDQRIPRPPESVPAAAVVIASPTRGRPRGHSPPWRSRALWS